MKKYLISIVAIALSCVAYAGSAYAFFQPIPSPSTFRTMDFFATSTLSVSQGIDATSTLAGSGFATSTNITPWFDSDGYYEDGSILLAGAKRATFYLTRGGTATNLGATAFFIQVSPDGTNWYNDPEIIPVAASTTVGMGTLSASSSAAWISAATSTSIVSLNLIYDAWYKARVVVQNTLDGQAFAKVSVYY